MDIEYINRCKILITGSTGVLGTALKTQLMNKAFKNCYFPSRKELNLLDREKTLEYIEEIKPDIIIHLASLVYGLEGNLKNQFLSASQNTLINNNLFEACFKFPPKKIFYSGTVASYPFPYHNLPLNEKEFFKGLPHYGEFGYAMAKRHAYTYLEILKQEKGVSFIYGIFTNLFGEHDNFDAETGHVIPSLISKAYKAKKLGGVFEVWGDGLATRDFLYASEAAAAILFLLNTSVEGLINISSNESHSIKEVSELLIKFAGIESVKYLLDKPVGIPNRIVCNKKLLSLGFKYTDDFISALEKTYKWYSNQEALVI